MLSYAERRKGLKEPVAYPNRAEPHHIGVVVVHQVLQRLLAAPHLQVVRRVVFLG